VTKSFADKAGVAMGYVKTRKWDNATVGKVLAWMTDNQGTNEDGAKYFLKTYPDMWTKWVAPDVAAKVKASI
jgi:glycine betaine/proline transport system substrate-binding protein